MARRRVNLLAVRARVEAARTEDSSRDGGVMRKLLPVFPANLLTVALLSLSFIPFDCWYFAYFALVPWMFMLPRSREAHRALWRWVKSPVQAANAEGAPKLKIGVAGWAKFRTAIRFVGALLLSLVTSAGFLFWAINLYWLWWITLEGYGALVVYLWLYWLVAGGLLNWSLRRRMPMVLMLPLVWVSLECIRSYCISGFPWFFLGHSQYAQTTLIQIADTTGQYGLSFAICMVNGLIVDALRGWRHLADLALPADGVAKAATPAPNTWSANNGLTMPPNATPATAPANSRRRWLWRMAVGTILTACVWGGIIGYGMFRLGEQTMRPGPVVGTVQQAYPIALNRPSEPQEVVLRHHKDASEPLIGQGCDLVIWPETMLPNYLNAEAQDIDVTKLNGMPLRALAYRFFGPVVMDSSASEERIRENMMFVVRFDDRKKYAKEVELLSQKLGCPLLAGGLALHRNPSPIDDRDIWMTQNSAMLFEQSSRPLQEYAKVHLVPFSEYVPFKSTWLGLHKLLRSFVPPVMEQLEPGDAYRTFTLKRADKTWGIAVPICYEGVFDRLCRQMVVQDGKKVADIMVNISNDGWFVWKWFDNRGSTEQPQHLAQYCFRAVENRVPVVRAVNTGISASIDSNGRILSTVHQQDQQVMVTGTMLLKDGAKATTDLQVGPQVLVDERLSLYSRYGDVAAWAIVAAAFVVFAVMAISRRKSGQEETR